MDIYWQTDNENQYTSFKIYWSSVCMLEVFCYNLSAKEMEEVQEKVRKNSTDKMYFSLKDQEKKQNMVPADLEYTVWWTIYAFIYLPRFCKS